MEGETRPAEIILWKVMVKSDTSGMETMHFDCKGPKTRPPLIHVQYACIYECTGESEE